MRFWELGAPGSYLKGTMLPPEVMVEPTYGISINGAEPGLDSCIWFLASSDIVCDLR